MKTKMIAFENNEPTEERQSKIRFYLVSLFA